MSKTDVIIISGIVMACVWLMIYILIEDDKKRKVIIAVGVIIDIILYIIGRNTDFLLCGIVGGILFSFVPARSRSKYENAIKEAKGHKNYTIVFAIFTVMIFMIVSIAYPGVEIAW